MSNAPELGIIEGYFGAPWSFGRPNRRDAHVERARL